MNSWRKLRGATVAMIMVACIAKPGIAAQYVVSPTGNDTNAGTVEQPWATLAKATAEDAPVAPGDTILVLPGTYRGDVCVRRSGEKDRPLLIQASEWGRTRIQGFVACEKPWVRMEGFDITQMPGVPEQQMALVRLHGQGISVTNCVVHGYSVGNDPSMGHGVQIEGDECAVSGCLIFGNGYESNTRTSGHAIYALAAVGARVAGNITFANRGYAITTYGLASPDVVLRNNICISEYGSAIGVESGHPRALVEGNVVYMAPECGSGAAIIVRGGDTGCARIRDNLMLSRANAHITTGLHLVGDIPLGPAFTGNRLFGFREFVNGETISMPDAAFWFDNNTYGVAQRPGSFHWRDKRWDFDAWREGTGFDVKSQGGCQPETVVFLFDAGNVGQAPSPAIPNVGHPPAAVLRESNTSQPRAAVLQTAAQTSRYHVAAWRPADGAPAVLRDKRIPLGAKYQLINVRQIAASGVAEALAHPVAEGLYDAEKGITIPDVVAGEDLEAYVMFVTSM